MKDAQRGEVWLVDLGYVAKTRPGVILSIGILAQDRALATLVAHTTSTRGTRFEVPCTNRAVRPGAFDAQDLVTIPLAKFIRKLGQLTAQELAEVEDAVRLWLGL